MACGREGLELHPSDKCDGKHNSKIHQESFFAVAHCKRQLFFLQKLREEMHLSIEHRKITLVLY